MQGTGRRSRFFLCIRIASSFPPQTGSPLPAFPQRRWWVWAVVLVIFLTAAFVGNAIAAWYVGSENIVYGFDSVGYWSQFIGLKERLLSDLPGALAWLWADFRQSDYPVTTIIPLLPFAFFGATRLWYILSIVNALALPAIASFLLATHPLVGRMSLPALPRHRLRTVTMATIIILFSPTFWIVTLAGLPSVGGLAIVFFVLFLTFRDFPRLRWREELATGILLFLLARFRRWYLIWIVTYYALRACFLLASSLRKRDWRILLHPGLRLCCGMGLLGVLLFTLTTPFAIRALTSDYAALYAPFQVSRSWLHSFVFVLGQLGYIAVLLSFAGFLCALFQPRLRSIALFLALQFAACIFIQMHMQGFAHQHLYLLLPSLLFSTFFLLERLTRPKYLFVPVTVAFSFLFLFLFLGTIYPPVIAHSKRYTPWVSTEIWPPEVRTDTESLRAIHQTLSELTYGSNSSIDVLASSKTFSYALISLQHLTFPQQTNLLHRVLPTDDVDLRDGFPAPFFLAKFVVIAEPLQLLSRKEYSRILVFPAERILNAQGLGQAYRKLPYRFTLENNVTVSIFERTRALLPAEARELSDALKAYYPDNPFVYTGAIAPQVFLRP